MGAAGNMAYQPGDTLAAAPSLVYDIAPNRVPARFGLHGLGLDAQTKQLVIASPAITAGVLTAGGSASIAATAWGAMAIPVIGAVVAGVTLGLQFLLNRKGPAQKIATTKIVDSIENGWTGTDGVRHPGLKDNLIGYMQGPRTVSSQLQALANFDAAWGYVVANCNTAKMGDPGQRCVADRQQGACKWQRGPGDSMEQYDGVHPGECWNWFTGYRDPIARDIPVPDPTVTQETASAIDSVVASLGIGNADTSTYLMIGGIVLVIAAMMGGGK